MRPILRLLTSHWLCALGAALVTTSVFSWLVLPLHVTGHFDNPYIGLLAFIAIPAVFFSGLAMMPVGVWLAKRRIAAGLAVVHDRHTVYRRIAWFFGTMTMLNVLIASQVTYKAVAHMETVQFCGQTCHVMKPQFVASQTGAHRNLQCVECHVSPGAMGWFRGKMAGTRQLVEVVSNNYPRPVPSALETNRLVSSVDTCEQCHSRATVTPARLRIIRKYADDAANTRTQTVLMMLVGRIHSAHMGPGVGVRYRADSKRQTIPWVEYSNGGKNVSRTYVTSDAKANATAGMQVYGMQCVDCHNMPAHASQLPEQAVDQALTDGRIPTSLPFIRKRAVRALRASYSSDAEAAQKIPALVTGAAQTVLDIYRRNVFPDLKVTWGTYVNQLGHTDTPGCFRCHDEGHVSKDKKTITQDCGACHNVIAVDEAAPDVLNRLLPIADATRK